MLHMVSRRADQARDCRLDIVVNLVLSIWHRLPFGGDQAIETRATALQAQNSGTSRTPLHGAPAAYYGVLPLIWNGLGKRLRPVRHRNNACARTGFQSFIARVLF
jgi:hypothetical protein